MGKNGEEWMNRNFATTVASRYQNFLTMADALTKIRNFLSKKEKQMIPVRSGYGGRTMINRTMTCGTCEYAQHDKFGELMCTHPKSKNRGNWVDEKEMCIWWERKRK